MVAAATVLGVYAVLFLDGISVNSIRGLWTLQNSSSDSSRPITVHEPFHIRNLLKSQTLQPSGVTIEPSSLKVIA